VSYYATLQEIPGIKPDCIPIVRDIIEAAKRKVSLSHAEGFEEELSRFSVEDDGDIHPDEWYCSGSKESGQIEGIAKRRF